jgi:hypothetical protein
MRDLRGEKPCNRCPSPPHTDRDAPEHTDADTDRYSQGTMMYSMSSILSLVSLSSSSLSSYQQLHCNLTDILHSASNIFHRSSSSHCGTAETTPQDDSGSAAPEDDGVWQTSRDNGTSAAPPPAPTREQVKEKLGAEQKEKETEGAASSTPQGSEPTPQESTKEECKEGGQEGSVSSGVRLALLPDFRSKILWLAALVDVEGVIVIVKEELHGRLKEIVEAAYVQSEATCGPVSTPSLSSPSLLSSSSSSSTDGSCDSFCSLVIRGIKSAAAPLSDVK